MLAYLLAALLGYLLGSFPTGYLAARRMAGVDVRTVGSGRTGSTNVLRAAGPRATAVTAFGDAFKGALAVLLARLLWEGDPTATALAALFAFLGHNYSIFLRFKGGAGTMTGAGILLALSPVAFAFAAPIPIAFLFITRMSSIASLLGSSIALLVALLLVWQRYLPVAFLLFFVPFFLLSWHSHRPNIERLRAGTERRIGDKVAGGSPR